MKTKSKRLSLNKETLRGLNRSELDQAAGGTIISGVFTACCPVVTPGCPQTGWACGSLICSGIYPRC